MSNFEMPMCVHCVMPYMCTGSDVDVNATAAAAASFQLNNKKSGIILSRISQIRCNVSLFIIINFNVHECCPAKTMYVVFACVIFVVVKREANCCYCVFLL